MIQPLALESRAETVGESSEAFVELLRLWTDLSALAEGMIAERDAALAELAALKAEREASLIQKVGQRFVRGDGVAITITQNDGYGPYPWCGVSDGGFEFHFAGSGRSAGSRDGMNLVGPVPDELAEAERLTERNRELIREKGELQSAFDRYRALHELSPRDDVRDLPSLTDDGTKDVCGELYERIKAEVKDAIAGSTFYVRIAMRGCEFLPLKVEGEACGQAFCASHLPGFSRRGIGLIATYEVQTWKT